MLSFFKPYLTYIVVGVIVILLLACAWLYATKAGAVADLKEAEAQLEVAKGVIKQQRQDNIILTSANESKAKAMALMEKQTAEINEKMASLAKEKLSLQKRLDRMMSALPPVVVVDNCQPTQQEQENSMNRLNLLWTDYCSVSANDPYCLVLKKTQGE